MVWVHLILGAIFEIGWAVGLKLSEGFTLPLPSLITVICLLISFYFFTKALRQIEVGTGYAVYTGIGAAGTAVIGMIFLGDTIGALKVFFIALLIIGIIGLKLSDGQTVETAVE
ncbi:multidrug efflux SMR transporter [Halobacillus rhizosphaerae]|uniref:DMT family transporter n=1 Tax=Halobacillus rhizosphaerae TaxID=3064889 RepID=UPI00398B1932